MIDQSTKQASQLWQYLIISHDLLLSGNNVMAAICVSCHAIPQKNKNQISWAERETGFKVLRVFQPISSLHLKALSFCYFCSCFSTRSSLDTKINSCALIAATSLDKSEACCSCPCQFFFLLVGFPWHLCSVVPSCSNRSQPLLSSLRCSFISLPHVKHVKRGFAIAAPYYYSSTSSPFSSISALSVFFIIVISLLSIKVPLLGHQ